MKNSWATLSDLRDLLFGNRKSVRVPRELARASNERDRVEKVTGSETTFPSWRGLLQPFFSSLAPPFNFSLSPFFFLFFLRILAFHQNFLLSPTLFLFDHSLRYWQHSHSSNRRSPVHHRRETTKTFPFTIHREARGATALGFDKRLRLFSGFPG